MGHPIHFKFRSRPKVYRIFGVGGSNGAISGSIKSRMAAMRHFGKLQRHLIFRTAFTDLEPVLYYSGHWRLFVLVSSFSYLFWLRVLD